MRRFGRLHFPRVDSGALATIANVLLGLDEAVDALEVAHPNIQAVYNEVYLRRDGVDAMLGDLRMGSNAQIPDSGYDIIFDPGGRLILAEPNPSDAFGLIEQGAISEDRTYTLPDAEGYFAIGASAAGVLAHSVLSGLTGTDHHTQYLVGAPGSTARNTVQPSAASAVPLKLLAHVSQSANLLEVWDALGSLVVKISTAGVLFGTGLDAQGGKGTNFATPTVSSDASNKGYVDGQLGVKIGQGTSFPGSPSDGERFRRTDLDGRPWFTYSSAISDWIGDERDTYDFAINANDVVTDQYMIGGAADVSSQWRAGPLQWNARMIRVGTFTSDTCTNTVFRVRRNGSDVVTVTRTTTDTLPTGTITEVNDATFGKGDMPQCYLDVGATDRLDVPQAKVVFARRA